MRRVTALIAAALLALLAAPASAQELTFFGPKQYDHPNPGTLRFVDTVRVPADVAGPFTLRVRNGDRRDGVRDAYVYLNGVRILGEDDFEDALDIERTVQLQAENRLVVVIGGRPRTHLTLSLSGRLIPPVPTALAPDPLTVYAGASANVVSTLAPAPRFPGALTVATADAGVATAPASVPFAAGQALVYIPVTGMARGSTALSVTLNGTTIASQINVVAPLVTALAPDPLRVLAGANALVVATLAPPPIADGALAVATGDPSVATAPASVPFAAGQTLVSIEVAGVAAGTTSLSASLNGSSVTSQVTVLPPPPQIGSISPASGAVGSLVTLAGENFDPVPAGNQVAFAGAGGAPVAAAVIAANASQVTVRVPEGAQSGPITLTDSRGTAQSPQFSLLPLGARLTATRAGLNAPRTTPGSPVTPFVQGADLGDALTFSVLAPPAKGTATVIGNKLVYQATTALNDVDQFPYRAVAADGSTLDGTALVKLFNAGNLTRCTQASTNVGGVVTRTNVLNCAFYGEIQTRVTAAGAPVSVQYIAVRPSNGSAPRAAVFLVGGGDFDLNFVGNAATGQASTIGGNFLVRTAQIFAEAGYLAIAMNKPSDLPIPGSIDPFGDADAYRISIRHAVDILAILREVNTDGLDVFLAGTSRGAISVVAANLIASGISISSPVTRGTSLPTVLFVNDARHANLLPGFVQRPAHVLWNTLDQCPLTRPADSAALAAALGAPGTGVTGGFINDTDTCGAQHFHGYMGIEPTAVAPVTGWLNDRLAALAGDRRPDAASASLPAAPGTPIAIDLAALTRDADGDLLSYVLSHESSSLGGTVALSGTTALYTPPAGVTSATDYFVYVVTDGRGGVGAAVITVKIGN